MRRWFWGTAALALALAAVPGVRAQSPFALSINGGGSFPRGVMDESLKVGWTAGANLWVNFPLLPLGLRIDGAYTAWDFETQGLGAKGLRMIDGSANLMWGFGAGTLPISPYLIGGVGVYNIGTRGSDDSGILDDASSTTKFGLNGGGGILLRLTGFSTFVEARYVRVMSDDDSFSGDKPFTHVPVVVGIRLGR